MPLVPRSFAVIAALAALVTPPSLRAQAEAQPAAVAFDKLKALAGDWIDQDGAFGMKGKVAVTYRVTGGGSTVIETLFVGTPHEMTTVYHKDGRHVVLTHYCAAGNQPRMRATTTDGRSLAFDFDGGTNLDPAKDGHMHAGQVEFVDADHVRATWIGWDKGKPSGHSPTFSLERKKS
jgi:hypothetical protein